MDGEGTQAYGMSGDGAAARPATGGTAIGGTAIGGTAIRGTAIGADAAGDRGPGAFEIEGHRLGYPTRFRAGTSMMAVLPASSRAVSRLLADTPFEVAEPLPGLALVGLNCVHYTDTDCGSYDEVALSVVVEPFGSPPRVRYRSVISGIASGEVPSYTWRLGVSTTLSRDCGRRMWGFPKELADLHHSRAGGRDRMAWRHEGATVLELAVPTGGTGSNGPIAPPVYSLMDGRPMVGRLRQAYTGVGYHRRGVQFVLGDHPVAEELRRLGATRMLVGVHNEHLDFEMGAPEPLSAAPAGTPPAAARGTAAPAGG